MICGSEILRKYLRTRCEPCIRFHCRTSKWPWHISPIPATFNLCQDSNGNKFLTRQQNRNIAKLAGNKAANCCSKPVNSQYKLFCYMRNGLRMLRHSWSWSIPARIRSNQRNDVPRRDKGGVMSSMLVERGARNEPEAMHTRSIPSHCGATITCLDWCVWVNEG